MTPTEIASRITQIANQFSNRGQQYRAMTHSIGGADVADDFAIFSESLTALAAEIVHEAANNP